MNAPADMPVDVQEISAGTIVLRSLVDFCRALESLGPEYQVFTLDALQEYVNSRRTALANCKPEVGR